jgi:hypothetical protein
MQIVIDIDDKLYERITVEKEYYLEDGEDLCSAIENGTPLPKGHKALIDIGNIDVIELEDSIYFIRHEKGDDVDVYISAPIIIEADREVNNENNNN